MLKNKIYRSVLKSVRSFGQHRFFHSPLVAHLLWDTAPREALLLAVCRSEMFVVAAGDPVIGQWLFKHREPYNFSTLHRVASLLSGRRLTSLIDIGANIGTICIPAVKRGLFERAIAIEPESLNYSLLRTNVEVNRVSAQITTHNIALGEKNDETLSFELSKTNFGNHRVRYGNDRTDPGEGIEVPSQSLDRIAEGVDLGSALLWMDTQGFEGYVLAGGPRTLQRKPPLVMKFWPGGLSRSGGMERLRYALQRAGYTSFCDLNEPGDAFRPFSVEVLEILAAKLGSGDGQHDLLLV
ncbi:FkbM family methyltransferase [Variovorax sp. MHTC-1]|uniref:FkbM family methyltransferase n=1 Tax=Variovorax sp. MHTC-1 TaxID=2495593 RepID=UPI00163C7FB1|nr:FkbM family methyltransferase [Variovorax sp. MHTC-1]